MKPIVQAFLLADHIYQDKHTGKAIIAGCFTRYKRYLSSDADEVDSPQDAPHRMQANQPPTQPGSPYAYLNLVSVKRECTIELRWVRLSDNKVYFWMQAPIRPAKDPLQHVEAIVPLPMLPFEGEGSYALELLTDNEPLATWRVTLEVCRKGEKS